MVNFTLHLFDEVAMQTYNFVFVILNSVFPAILDVTQFLVQFNPRWRLQLIKGISNDRQILLKYFIGTTVFAFFNTPSAAVLPKTLDLYLNDNELVVETSSRFSALFIGD